MARLHIFLLVLLSCSSCFGKFTSTKLVSFPPYTYSHYNFVYENQIVVGLDVVNSPVNSTSAIALYDFQGTLNKIYHLPFYCKILNYCNSGSFFVVLAGSVVTVQSYSDEGYHFVSFDLSVGEFVLISPPVTITPSNFMQLSSSLALMDFYSPDVRDRVATLELANFTSTAPHSTSLYQLDFPMSVLTEDTLYMCATVEKYSDYTFHEVDIPTIKVKNSTKIGCPEFVSYSPEQSQIVLTYGDKQNNIGLEFISVTKDGLTVLPTQVPIVEGAYACDLATSANFAFIAARYWADQMKSYVFQMATKLGSAQVLDKIQLPDGYLNTGSNVPYQHAIVSEEAMIYAGTLYGGEDADDYGALFIATFDAN